MNFQLEIKITLENKIYPCFIFDTGTVIWIFKKENNSTKCNIGTDTDNSSLINKSRNKLFSLQY